MCWSDVSLDERGQAWGYPVVIATQNTRATRTEVLLVAMDGGVDAQDDMPVS